MLDEDLRGWLAAQTWPDLRARIEAGPVAVYEHPYGFVVCRLEADLFAHWQIRVHLWRDRLATESAMMRSGALEQQVHAHGWPLMSAVVLGALDEHTYSVVASDSESGRALYRVSNDYASGESALALDQPQVTVDHQDHRIRQAGPDVFEIAAGTFHTSTPAHGPTATVVATGLSGGPSFVVAPTTSGSRTQNPRHGVPGLRGWLSTYDDLHAAAGADRWASFGFVVDGAAQVLMMRTTRRPDLWAPVGGRQEAGDSDPVATLVRELREEVGLDVERADLLPLCDFPRDVGLGRVYFSTTRLCRPPVLSLQTDEVIETRWFSVHDLKALPAYPGTRLAVERLCALLE